MKRFAIFLGSLLVMPAFAEVVPDWYFDETVVEYEDAQHTDDASGAETKTDVAAVKPSRQINSGRVKTANRSTTARTVPTNSVGTTTRASNSNSKRVVAARTGTTQRTAERGAISRAAARPMGRVSGTRALTARSATPTSGTNNVVSRAATTKYTSIQGSGTTLYNPNNVSRLGVRSDASTARSPIIRVASSGTTVNDASVSTANMDELAELTDYCKAQYAACMDEYCNVLDGDQGRCICSANLKNYSKTEEGLKKATEELQEVAQKIRYIGLSSREIDQLFSQTEAELAMQSKSDTTQLKTSLDKIKGLIVDVQGGTSTSSGLVNMDLSGLLDFTIDSSGFDISSFLGVSDSSNVSNQRGKDLFNTASARCKANVLNACVAQGVDASIITNSYDLGIDQACMAYERSLTDSNDQMVATIRNAKTVLQQARYLVAKQKNEYDMRQCINQLDTCMQDDFVCGSDYENCLDPTGQYIVNGAVVVGSTPGLAGNSSSDVYATWNYGTNDNTNAWGNGTLAEYITATVTDNAAVSPSTQMSEYLQNKIGYIDGEKSYGMCVSVLKKCQDYSYSGTGSNIAYDRKNSVIKQYLNRVLVQIKARQDEVLAEYAEKCSTDVASCLNQNGYPSAKPHATSGWSDSKERVAIAACNSVITTCMSVNGETDMTGNKPKCWARSVQYSDYDASNDTDCPDSSSGGSGNLSGVQPQNATSDA